MGRDNVLGTPAGSSLYSEGPSEQRGAQQRETDSNRPEEIRFRKSRGFGHPDDVRRRILAVSHGHPWGVSQARGFVIALFDILSITVPQ